MDEVVSVSDLSPLEAGITGATVAPFSCSAGCSGTGIADSNRHEGDTLLGRLSVQKKKKKGARHNTSFFHSNCVSFPRFPLGKSSGLLLLHCTGKVN